MEDKRVFVAITRLDDNGKADYVEISGPTVDKLLAVYDAAMAWLKARDREGGLIHSEEEAELLVACRAAEDVLYNGMEEDVRRRAKEVERGQ